MVSLSSPTLPTAPSSADKPLAYVLQVAKYECRLFALIGSPVEVTYIYEGVKETSIHFKVQPTGRSFGLTCTVNRIGEAGMEAVITLSELVQQEESFYLFSQSTF